ncbi:hypothetical protein [Lactiplantibacillus plantarum]|uniref:hypothetical protein n=1 Tax=Lactiplantibacillus plantarum TaxID=1590 RepID=UPI000776C1A8|nr:hypothetical protein [Lactiplantibacillus plantarum]AMO29970.1 hypothetical protein ABT40_08645 [Lactiplantibacillus plantarum]AZU39028.1 hypothetical protein B1H25_05445 [Lactiplantibacillus plantarum]MBO3685615.1 hypothetical protein [Lactiplantibacillus plantarum]MCI3956716.1 hypothetical protein [Lactiplantibacillus plantarum]MCT0496553.1 hypothetical protein [Lactiplantibacillus plantarum]
MLSNLGGSLHNDQQGSHFLVKHSTNGYNFYQLPVRAGHSPLASVLWDLRYTIGIDVDQLRLYDSIMAELDDEKVAVFVFDHLTVDGQVRAKFDRQGLEFVLASELHELFTSVRVSETMPFTNLSK